MHNIWHMCAVLSCYSGFDTDGSGPKGCRALERACSPCPPVDTIILETISKPYIFIKHLNFMHNTQH